MKKDKTILYVGLGLAALLALRYFSKKKKQTNDITKDEFSQPQVRMLTPEELAIRANRGRVLTAEEAAKYREQFEKENRDVFAIQT